MTASTAPVVIDQSQVQARIAEFVDRITDLNAQHHAERFPNLTPETYTLQVGRKFTRVVKVEQPSGREASVHCFIENATGKVIKAAGWSAPAKVKTGLAYRWDLMDDESREAMYAAWDPYGGYLYAV